MQLTKISMIFFSFFSFGRGNINFLGYVLGCWNFVGLSIWYSHLPVTIRPLAWVANAAASFRSRHYMHSRGETQTLTVVLVNAWGLGGKSDEERRQYS